MDRHDIDGVCDTQLLTVGYMLMSSVAPAKAPAKTFLWNGKETWPEGRYGAPSPPLPFC